MTALKDIRSAFLDFFNRQGHETVSSASLVPHNDPTLLFTNAGMVPFKNLFTGAETRDYVRAASSQKCVRAGGKHNDLDNVGYTARHHTFFEMLGNFSFGDYFKEEAIGFAWDLVTRVYALSADRLTVTVYHEDDEAFDLWRRISGLPEERIIRIPTSDNFWAMGDTGPCGPCSEIFFDHGDHIPGGPPGSPDEDGDRFVEIWNLVFMQFETLPSGERINLPKPSIDTGMGLERIAAVLQGVHDNYDTDLFKTLIEASAELSGAPADGEHAVAHRVIADHLRAATFLISDGVLPSNDGRGYVLRRILRRGMRYAHSLGGKDPLFHRLAPTLISEMGTAYPDLQRAQALIEETLRFEEEKFQSMLDRGLKLLDEEVSALSGGAALSGEAAFKLYDTYGFPLDLTQDALRRRGIDVDVDGFDAAMQRQKEAARANWSGSGDSATEALWFDIREDVGATEFLGYETERAEGVVLAIVKDGARVESVEAGAEAQLILNQTPFYAESGGQVGDAGLIFAGDGAEFIVEDVQKRAGDLFAHIGRVSRGTLKVDDAVALHVDGPQRTLTRANHSATHLLHAALRDTLGGHVSQKGSYVGPDRLRFDISHSKSITPEELEEIEARVNTVVLDNKDVTTRIMEQQSAIEAGALALFGEKYDDDVRVLFMGEGDASSGRDIYSVELCGGTHVRRVGDIGLFVIVSESAVGSGVRRIEGLTGEAARKYLRERDHWLSNAASTLRTPPAETPARVKTLWEENRRLERELSEAKKKLAFSAANGGGGEATSDEAAVEISGVKVMARTVEGVAPKDLRALVDEGKKQLGSGVVAFIGANDGKAALAVGVTKDLVDRVSAVELARAGAEAMGGKGGGGRPDMAQAGGPDASKSAEAIAAIESVIAGAAG